MKAIVTTVLGAFIWVSALTGGEYGEYIGTLQTEWLEDGRKMRLLSDFKYIGPENSTWLAPKGSIIDGASIPQAFWSVIGGPFEGLYRNASVIHDVGCDEKTRPWQMVHQTFYHGMRCSGVGPIKSQVMYAAVYYFGPRWPMKVQMLMSGGNSDAELEKLSKQAPVGSEIVTVVNARPFRLFGQKPVLDDPTLSAIVFPPQAEITPEQFEELRGKIEASEGKLALAEIHNFGAIKNVGLKTRLIRDKSMIQSDRIKEYLKTQKLDLVKLKALERTR